jgi:hypothetical protein
MDRILSKKMLVVGLVVVFFGASVVPTLGDYIHKMDNITTLASEKNGRSGYSDWLGNQRLTSGGPSENPVIQTDSLDSMHIVWSNFTSNHYQIYYKKLSSTGNEIIHDKQVSSTTASAQYPSLGIDSANNVHIVWQDNRNANWQIYYSKLDSNGNIVINNRQITARMTPSQYPVIKISETNNVHIAWQDYEFGNYEIYYNKLDNNGNTLIPETRITLEGTASEHPSIGLYSDFLANIAWQDNRSGNPEIYYDDVKCDIYPISINYSCSGTNIPSPHLAIIGPGNVLTITVEVHNAGDYAVTNVIVDVLFDGVTQIASLPITSIPANSNGSAMFSWPLNSVQQGRHNLVVKVDPLKQIPDVDRTNNNMTKYLPILDSYNVHTSAWPQSSSYPYPSNTIIACNNLQINTGGSLSLQNSDLIIFNPSPNEYINGRLSALNSIITTSDPFEYIPHLSIGGNEQVNITGCYISQLAGNGIEFNRPGLNLIFSGNTITNFQNIAITCQSGGPYNFDNNIIIGSGSYDFSVQSAQVIVTDSFFNENKVQMAYPSSQFSYNKHIGLTFLNANNTPANHARVEIKNKNGANISWGYTNITGHFTPVQPLLVFDKTGPSTNDYAPFSVSTTGQSGTCNFGINPGGGLLNAGKGFFDGVLHFYKTEKYALLIAGSDNGNRLGYWNDVEYAYHVLKDIKCYKPGNIVVMFTDGKDGHYANNAIINDSATKDHFNQSLKTIGSRMINNATEKDTLFIYASDHGGTVNASSSLLCMNSGLNVGSYQLSYWLRDYIAKNASRIYIVMNQCYGAGFIRALHADNRVIQTASKQNHGDVGETWSVSYTEQFYPYHSEGNAYFSVEYWSALHNHNGANGKYPDADLTYYPTDYYEDPYGKHPTTYYHDTSNNYQFKNLDDNNDGFISLHEAFDYALDNDLTGPINGKQGSLEFPQEVDDDVVVIAGLFGQFMIYRYDTEGKLSGTSVNIGGTIRKMFVRDMNNDGYDDIVAVDCGNNQVDVLLNKGDWTFNTSTCAVGQNPWGLAIADVNNDGWLDIITTNWDDNDISVLLNKKDGTFGPRTDYDVGSEPWGIAAADLNKDGKTDLAITDWGGNYYNDKMHYNISILFNDGSGGFGSKTNYSVPTQPSSVATGDVDNDGDNDLIITRMNWHGYGPGNANIWKNDGTGVFTNYSQVKTGNYPVTPYLVDLNNNGSLDMLIPNFLDHSVMVYKDNSNGKFTQVGNYSTGKNSTLMNVFVTDLDGDGDLDMIVPTITPNSVFVFLNQDTNKQGNMYFYYTGVETQIASIVHQGYNVAPYAIDGTNHNRAQYWYP